MAIKGSFYVELSRMKSPARLREPATVTARFAGNLMARRLPLGHLSIRTNSDGLLALNISRGTHPPPTGRDTFA